MITSSMISPAKPNSDSTEKCTVIVKGLFDYFFGGLFTVRVAMEENLRKPHCGPIRWNI